MYVNPDYLVETDWLAEHLDDSALRVFDVTGMLTASFDNLARERSYSQGHVPGAAFLDVASRHGPLYEDSGLPWMAASSGAAAKALAVAGIGDQHRVVLYASSPRPGIDKGTMWATRAWWLLHGWGVRCAVLNGGFDKWVAEGRPVEQTSRRYPPAASLSAVGGPAMAGKDDVLAALADDRAAVVDALPEAVFSGRAKVAYGERKGHIEGATNVPMDDLLGSDGCFLPAAALRAALDRAGLLDRSRVITYCGGGIAATVDAFALALLGYENVSVYDASLFEWSNDPALPMTNPSAAQ